MKTVSIRLPETEVKRIRDTADKRGETLSDYFRNSVRAREEKANLTSIEKAIATAVRDTKYLKIFLEEMTRRMFKDPQKGEQVLVETLRSTIERTISEED